MKRSMNSVAGIERCGRHDGKASRGAKTGASRALAAFGLLLAGAAVLAIAGLAVADTVYVVSYSTGGLYRYDSADPAGTLSPLLAPGTLSNPSALAVGPDGALYIGESGNFSTIGPQIRRFDVTTGVLGQQAVSLQAVNVYPASLVFKGNDLLVGRNPFFPFTGPVVKVSGVSSGTATITNYTSGSDLAGSPGLALGADGSLYVSDQTYNVSTGIATGPVKKFDAAGNYVGEVIASGASGLFGPTGLLISGSTLYTASIMSGAVLKTDLTTQVTSPFGSTGAAFGAGPLAMMTADRVLAGSPAGDGAIYQFYADGTSGPTFSSGLGQIGGIVAVPEPGSVTLAVTGAGLAAWCAWRRRRAGSRLRRS